jgi:hypothetical protein
MNEEIARRALAERLYSQRNDQLGYLPVQILLDLARNEAAPREWRKAAVQLLLDKQATQANHPDLALLVQEIKQEQIAKHDVQAVVESAMEEEWDGAPTMTCGVTTANLQQPDIVRNPDALGDDALNDSPVDEGLLKALFKH